MNLPLKTYLTQTYALLILAFALVLSFLVEHAATERLQREIGTGFGELAYQIGDKLDRGMFERYRDLAVAATMAAVPGEGTRSTIRRDWLDELQATYPYYKWIGFADLDGIVQVSTKGLLEGHSVAERPWFSEGLEGVFYGDVHKALLLEKLLPASNAPWRFVDVAVPVRDQQGRVVGVLASHLSWGWASEVRQSVLLPEFGDANHEALVVSESNEVLLGPPELVGTKLNLEVLEAVSVQPQHRIEQWPDGKRYLAGAVATGGHREYPGLGWRVVVRESVDTAFEEVAALRWRILGIGLLLSGAFFFISWIHSVRIARPLQALTVAADQMRAGAREIEFPKDASYREGRLLTQSLRALLGQFLEHEDQLMAANANLESRVQDRTAELQAEISERRRVQASLERSEANLRTLTDNIPALTGYLDADRYCRFANRAFGEWFGIEAATLPGKHLAELFSPGEYGALERHLSKAYAGERVCTDIRGVHDAMPQHMELTLIPDFGAEGEVVGVYVTVQDISIRKAQQLQLAQEVLQDALTGLPNRKGLHHRLKQALQRASRNREWLAVMFLDLDRFKAVNDTFGHSVGDELLRSVAQRLAGTIRATDTVARLAGDEFVVVLEGLDDGTAGATHVATKIVAAFAEPFHVSGKALRVSTSIGIALAATGTTPPGELLRRADQAMYRAKRQGRNAFSFHADALAAAHPGTQT